MINSNAYTSNKISINLHKSGIEKEYINDEELTDSDEMGDNENSSKFQTARKNDLFDWKATKIL